MADRQVQLYVGGVVLVSSCLVSSCFVCHLLAVHVGSLSFTFVHTNAVSPFKYHTKYVF